MTEKTFKNSKSARSDIQPPQQRITVGLNSSRIQSPALKKNARADICVVGAGIAGLTTGYLPGAGGKIGDRHR